MSYKKLEKYYAVLMDARSKLMHLAANSHNDELQKQTNIAWQTITKVTLMLDEMIKEIKQKHNE